MRNPWYGSWPTLLEAPPEAHRFRQPPANRVRRSSGWGSFAYPTPPPEIAVRPPCRFSPPPRLGLPSTTAHRWNWLMTDSPLFTVADLDTLPRPQMGVGSHVTLPHGSRGVIVAPDPTRGGWWLVKLSSGSILACTPSSLDLS